MKKLISTFFILSVLTVSAQEEWGKKFEQLGETLPTPNSYRTGSGAPGEKYWQQRADYIIDVSIDENTQILSGKETITYYN
ncbi:MAG: M1 family peptidase, partial [Cyclobacteriaceae bacterium]|nr:M1 family peptidase [Cyclobacteriaceae bacterium]